MFYINTRKKTEKIKEKDFLNSLIIPSQERTQHDHQTIYRYFADNQLLIQLERTKSLNARIKCIASLLLINKVDFNPEEHIQMHQFQDERIVILSKQVKNQTEHFNQKIIRKKMDEITPFSIMQSLKYDELLYLAYNIEPIQCKYKDVLYHQGDQPQYIYFIEKGQFNYIKQYSQAETGKHINKKRKNKHGSPLKSLEGIQDSPNKYVKPQVHRYKVGIVEGNLGQCIGLEEVVLERYNQARIFTVICNSTENSLIKLHKKYLEVIFQQFPNFREQLIRQIGEANDAKIQLFKKIKNTQHNLKDYLKKSTTDGNVQHLQQTKSINKSRQNLHHDESLSRYKLPSVQKKSAISYEYRSRAFSSALTTSMQAEDRRFRSMKSQSNLQMQQLREQDNDNDGHTFFTGVKDYESGHLKLVTKLSEPQQKQIESYTIDLPHINKKSAVQLQKIDEETNKHFDNRPKSKIHIYGGMIDSSTLVKQKQHIMERRGSRKMREELFPPGHIPYHRPPKLIDNLDPMKIKASPAHSHRFMERLLLKVLKKAGYDDTQKKQLTQESKTQSKTAAVKQINHNDFYRSISKRKKREQIKLKNSDQLLVNSAFDECYFSKI